LHYGWSHDETGRLTPRQAAGYYQRLTEMLGGEEGGSGQSSGKEQDWDMNEIYGEAETLGIPTPKD
jgi:hypothetical protein